jgi:hypothetical protein
VVHGDRGVVHAVARVRLFKEDEGMNLESKIRREYDAMWKTLNLDELIPVVKRLMQGINFLTAKSI